MDDIDFQSDNSNNMFGPIASHQGAKSVVDPYRCSRTFYDP